MVYPIQKGIMAKTSRITSTILQILPPIALCGDSISTPSLNFPMTNLLGLMVRGGGINRSMNLLIRGFLRNPVILTSSLSMQKLLTMTF